MSDAFPPLILASASPRRRELLALLGLPFEIVPSRYEEPQEPLEPLSLSGFVTTLAGNKAQEVASRLSHGLVLGADTTVTLAEGDFGVPLGKPRDAEEARQMLRLLSGRVHVVHTGIALIHVDTEDKPPFVVSASEATRVRFRPMTDAMIEGYIATGEPFDKAGAYGAQGYAAPFIEGFEGDFFNVVGLPLCAVGKLLEQSGFAWWQNRSKMPGIIG